MARFQTRLRTVCRSLAESVGGPVARVRPSLHSPADSCFFQRAPPAANALLHCKSLQIVADCAPGAIEGGSRRPFGLVGEAGAARFNNGGYQSVRQIALHASRRPPPRLAACGRAG
jgi:hypothetical protein